MAYSTAGRPVTRCGAANPRPAAQRASGVQDSAGGSGGAAADGRGFTVRGRGAGARNHFAAGLVQFNGDEPTVLVSRTMPGGGGVGRDAQPASSNNPPQKMIPTRLNTRSLCAIESATQAVSPHERKKAEFRASSPSA